MANAEFLLKAVVLLDLLIDEGVLGDVKLMAAYSLRDLIEPSRQMSVERVEKLPSKTLLLTFLVLGENWRRT